MDRRSQTSLWRDYGVPMQDPKAFSLQYGKDTSRDPSKGPIKKKSTKAYSLTDTTGLLKLKKSSLLPGKNVLYEGGKLGIGGMGQMQGKAPQPTNRTAPADKVKKSIVLYKRKKKEPKQEAFVH